MNGSGKPSRKYPGSRISENSPLGKMRREAFRTSNSITVSYRGVVEPCARRCSYRKGPNGNEVMTRTSAEFVAVMLENQCCLHH